MAARNTVITTTRRTRTDKQHLSNYNLDERIDHGDRIEKRHIELRNPDTESENYPKKESGNWKDIHYQENKYSNILVRKSQNDDRFIFSQHGKRVTSFSNLQAYDLAVSILKNMNALTTKIDFVKGHKYVRWTVRTRHGVKALGKRLRRRDK
jgi:hypothetical protein